MEKKSSDGQTRVGLAILLSSGTPIPLLPGSSLSTGWLLELLLSHLPLSQPLTDLSWKPHPWAASTHISLATPSYRRGREIQCFSWALCCLEYNWAFLVRRTEERWFGGQWAAFCTLTKLWKCLLQILQYLWERLRAIVGSSSLCETADSCGIIHVCAFHMFSQQPSVCGLFSLRVSGWFQQFRKLGANTISREEERDFSRVSPFIREE